mgnify:CR=1 FL=1
MTTMVSEREKPQASEASERQAAVDRTWFQTRLRELGASQVDMSRAIGMRPPAVSLMLSGAREVRAKEADAIAGFLRVPVREVLKRLGSVPPTEAPGPRLVGFLGARDVIKLATAEEMSDVDSIPSPPDCPECNCIIVRGDDNAPRFFDGDAIFYKREDMGDPRRLIGSCAVIGLATGEIFIKRILLSPRRGRFTLTSYNPLVEPMLDRAVEWAAPIQWIKPAGASATR